MRREGEEKAKRRRREATRRRREGEEKAKRRRRDAKRSEERRREGGPARCTEVRHHLSLARSLSVPRPRRYNLLFDGVLGLGLFPADVSRGSRGAPNRRGGDGDEAERGLTSRGGALDAQKHGTSRLSARETVTPTHTPAATLYSARSLILSFSSLRSLVLSFSLVLSRPLSSSLVLSRPLSSSLVLSRSLAFSLVLSRSLSFSLVLSRSLSFSPSRR